MLINDFFFALHLMHALIILNNDIDDGGVCVEIEWKKKEEKNCRIEIECRLFMPPRSSAKLMQPNKIRSTNKSHLFWKIV